ncbi:hypothetical protein [Streptoalloteichus hindustanus]|uniref:Uncharacterized protein n=1 Tax=Streptoalloteichus hindustanus TaxID=2017 RepID=A0A1M5NFW6_STRHI|nr:hypothetical protein [Streptoalloteichus hindustanus]SHG87853.1 hypothetical protein SAMN05444320_115114 [Streptoalloteichus hindustanus]
MPTFRDAATVRAQEPPSTPTSITRTAAALCAAAFGAALAEPHLPGGRDYADDFAPDWSPTVGAALAVPALVLARTAGRRAPRSLVLTTGSAGCALLLWSAGGLVFDLLRAVALLAGVLIIPSEVDWPGMLTRGLALAATSTTAVALRGYQRSAAEGCRGCGRPAHRTRPWFGLLALVAALPHTLTKVYWSLGGTAGATGEREADFANGWGAVVSGVLAMVLALALTQARPRVLPRWTLLTAGWAAAAVLVAPNLPAVTGLLRDVLGEAPPRVRHAIAPEVFPVVSFLVWGVALGLATQDFQRRTRTRTRCPRRE